MDDVRIHRADCNGFDENINCVGCFKAQVIELLKACHDHMLMDPTGRGTASRPFYMVSRFLDDQEHNNSVERTICRELEDKYTSRV
ncbi:MAG: hypothetical protein SWO11_21270 [Thermodesulfobacteriota bacterium]|nr:hypothetical protein [Thermodesulfobacteriota bacterium]